MMGRESDAIDLFCAWRDEGGAGLLIRATHDRGLAEETTLFETLRAAPAHGSTRSGSIVPRRGARRPALADGRPADPETPELGADPVTLTLVHLREDPVPKGGERIEWPLITTLPVGTIKQAQEVVDLYALRWRIEEYHRILTSGCDVEKIARTTAERVKRAVTVIAVIAWRLATLTLLGRETPERPAATMAVRNRNQPAARRCHKPQRRRSGPGRTHAPVPRPRGHADRKAWGISEPQGRRAAWPSERPGRVYPPRHRNMDDGAVHGQWPQKSVLQAIRTERK